MSESRTEEQLARRALILKARDGDIAARNELIENYLPLAMKEVGRFKIEDQKKDVGGFNDERASVARLALVEGVDRALRSFEDDDERYGIGPYLKRVIRSALADAKQEAESLVAVKRDVRFQQRRLRRGENLTTREKRRLELLHSRDRSLSEPVGVDDGNEPRLVSDVVADPNVLTPEEIIGTEEGHEFLRNLIYRVVPKPFDQEVALSKFGLRPDTPDCETEPEIAARLGVKGHMVGNATVRINRALRQVEGLRDFLRVHIGHRRVSRLKPPRPPLPGSANGVPLKSVTDKLDVEKVQRILELREQGVAVKDVAERFNVSPSSISAIMCGRTWKHVKRPKSTVLTKRTKTKGQ